MISAKEAKELSESYREELIKVTLKEVYTKITYASKRGLTSLRHISDPNLSPVWQTEHVFPVLVEELTRSGYLVRQGTLGTPYIEVNWD
jgi:hypothetical protein